MKGKSNKPLTILSVVVILAIILMGVSGTISFNLKNRGYMRSTDYISTDTYVSATTYMTAGTYITSSGYMKATDSLAVGGTNYIQEIGRTSYGDSLFIIAYAVNSGKDTTWLALN